MGDSDSLKVGQGVIAIGNALGYGQSVTVGYISALDREVRTSDDNITRNLLQTDAAINPGNSGGALLNMKGEVIGINSAKYSDTDVEGMGYAIPITAVQDIINDLMNTKTRTEVDQSKQGYLGIQGLTHRRDLFLHLRNAPGRLRVRDHRGRGGLQDGSAGQGHHHQVWTAPPSAPWRISSRCSPTTRAGIR